MFNCFLSLFVTVPVSDAFVNILSIVVFFSVNFSFFDIFLFLKNFCSIKYVLLALSILTYKSIWLLLSSLTITAKYLKFSTLSNLWFFIFKCPILFFFKLFFLSTIIYFVFSWFIRSPNFLAMFSISTKSCRMYCSNILSPNQTRTIYIPFPKMLN